MKVTATPGSFFGTTCAGIQLLSLKFCQDTYKYGYLACTANPLSKRLEWQKTCYAEGTCSVSEGAPSLPAHCYEGFFTLYIMTPLKRSQGHSIELPLNPSTPYYCNYHNSHFYIALFSTPYQKHECCRDQQRLCARFRNKTPNSVVFVRLKYYPVHLCSNKPGQENYMPLAIFRTEDFLKSCTQQHFFLYQHILVGLAVMLIVILECILSLPCSGNHTTGSWTPPSKAVHITPAGAEQLSGVPCVNVKRQERDLRAGWGQQDSYFYFYSCTRIFTKGEQEYPQPHRRNGKLSADFEESCPGAAGRHQMAEKDLRRSSRNAAHCFVQLVNNYIALNSHCCDLVKLSVKVLINVSVCLYWKRK